MKRKFKKGDKVIYRSQQWVVCDGGKSNTKLKSHTYKLCRGAWKRFVAGNCITGLVQA